MSKNVKVSLFTALLATVSISAFAQYCQQFPYPLRWTQVRTQIGGYNGLPMRHCGIDAVGPDICSLQDFHSRQECFMYWNAQDLGGGQKVYPIFQCRL